MIESIKLQNFLSFGNDCSEIELQSLNVIIGTNGSGKTNFLEAFDLLQNAPSDISKPIREGGGVSNWLHKGNKDNNNAVLEFVAKNKLPGPFNAFRYIISFNAITQKFELFDERIESCKHCNDDTKPFVLYNFNEGRNPVVSARMYPDHEHIYTLEQTGVDPAQSILSQKRDSVFYPEITFLANEFNKIRLYREWSFGRYNPPRLPQKVDLKNDYLESDCSNLCMVLNQIRNDIITKKRLLQELKYFYADVEDYEVTFAGGQAQIFFQEYGLKSSVPATRLSDGTLRYLCLLSILCHPTPPPLICIEEPELGMHPDVIPNLAKLLHEASERCQLIVTTHSEILIDAFTETPSVVIVAEKKDNGTRLERLDEITLKPWLEKYRLGNLWSRGDIGGTRW